MQNSPQFLALLASSIKAVVTVDSCVVQDHLTSLSLGFSSTNEDSYITLSSSFTGNGGESARNAWAWP